MMMMMMMMKEKKKRKKVKLMLLCCGICCYFSCSCCCCSSCCFCFWLLLWLFCGCSLRNNTQRKFIQWFSRVFFPFPCFFFSDFLSVCLSFISFLSFLSLHFAYFLFICWCCVVVVLVVWIRSVLFIVVVLARILFGMSRILLFWSFGGFFVYCCCLCCYVVKLAKAQKHQPKKKPTPKNGGRTSVHFEHGHLCLHMQKLLFLGWVYVCLFSFPNH